MVVSIFRTAAVCMVVFTFGSSAVHAAYHQPGRVEGETHERKETLNNLRSAYEGETKAAHRYQLFADRADQENHPDVAKLFRAASRSETIHRDNHERVIRELGGEVPKVELKDVKVASTKDNLKAAIHDEKSDGGRMYPKYIHQARKDRETMAERSFENARETERGHVKLFELARDNPRRIRNMDFYVNRSTGVILPMQKGKAVSQANRYYRVG